MTVVPQPDRTPSSFDRWSERAEGGRIIVLKGRFGRSTVSPAAAHLRNRRRDLDLKLSWREFESVPDWGRRWPTEQHAFAAGLILTPTRDPVVERAVGRCLFDLARLGRPLLWGVVSDRIRWRSRFTLGWNGWPKEWLPYPESTYARLGVADDSGEFCPRFDPILYRADPDFYVCNTRLYWSIEGLFYPVAFDG